MGELPVYMGLVSLYARGTHCMPTSRTHGVTGDGLVGVVHAMALGSMHWQKDGGTGVGSVGMVEASH